MPSSFGSFLRSCSRFFIYASFFVVPLTVMPFLPEAFEFPKQLVFYAFLLLALASWLGSVLVARTLTIRHTPLDRLFFILWLVYLVSALFSKQPVVSLLGNLSLPGPSFLSVTALLLFYFVILQVCSSLKDVLRGVAIVFSSVGLSALYSVLQLEGVMKHIFPALTVSTTLNPSIHLSALFGVVAFLLALAFLSIKKTDPMCDGLAILTLISTGILLIITGSNIGWVALLIGTSLLLVILLTFLTEVRSWWYSLAFSTVVISLLALLLPLIHFFRLNLPTEIVLDPSTSSVVAFSAVKTNFKSMVVGTGPETFAVNFNQFKPASFNTSPFWNVHFVHAGNSAVEWLGNVGILGSLALVGVFLAIIILIARSWLRHVYRSEEKTSTSPVVPSTVEGGLVCATSLGAVWLLLLGLFFVVYFSFVYWILFIELTAFLMLIFLALRVVAPKTSVYSLKISPRYALPFSFGSIVVFTALVVGSIYLVEWCVAEARYVAAIGQPFEKSIPLLEHAVELNPYQPLFHNALTQMYFAEAVDWSRRTNNTNQVYGRISQAINEAKKITELTPAETYGWEMLYTIYSNVQAILPDAHTWSVNSLAKIIELDPKNPEVYQTKASLLSEEKHFSEAEQSLEKALELKPDLLSSYMALAALKLKQSDFSAALVALERGLPYGANSPEYLVQIAGMQLNHQPKEDLNKAEAYLTRALVFNQRYPDALFLLAFIKEKRNQKQQALSLYQQVFQLVPGDKEVQKKINELSNVAPTSSPVVTSTPAVTPPAVKKPVRRGS